MKHGDPHREPRPESLPDEAGPAEPTRETVASLAYQYWEEQGCQHGEAMDHWLRAERVVHHRMPGSASAGSSMPVDRKPAGREGIASTDNEQRRAG